MRSVTGHFRYGINPGQAAKFDGLSDVQALGDQVLSLNAFADIQLGVSALAEAEADAFRLVYVKHKMPVIAVAEHSEREAVDTLLDVVRQTGNVEFGCLVSNFTLTEESIPLLDHVRIHTLAAKGLAVGLVTRLQSAEVQQVNRGLVAVAIGGSLRVLSAQLNLENGATVTHDDGLGRTGVDHSRMVSNRLWTEPRNLSLGISALRHARTISVCVLAQGAVKLVRCGFYDGGEALESALQFAVDHGIKVRDAVVLTDGCFGVKSPTTRLTERGVGGFVFCGGKHNDEALLGELSDAGIGALCTKARYFFY